MLDQKLTYHQDFRDGVYGKYAIVLARLPLRGAVLDIGCHTGAFDRVLMDRGYQVTGIEKNPEAAKVAMHDGIDVRCVDVETEGVEFLTQRFDVVLMLDVLEHMLDPQAVLMRAKSVLNPSGRIMITGPNVAHWVVRKDLLLGKWNYQASGILDRTHLHFYTVATWRALIESAGYRIIHSEPANSILCELFLFRSGVPAPTIARLRRLVLSIAPQFFAKAYLFEAVPLISPSATEHKV